MGADGISSTGLAVVSAVIAAAAAGVAVWRSILAGRQAREARKFRELGAVISLFNAHQAATSCWEQCARSFVREIRETQNDDFARELQEWVGAPDP